MPAINSVGVREKLKPQREPYWLRVTQGRFIGLRKMARGSPGTFLARLYDGERYHFHPLGDFADLPEKDRYDAAKKAAEDWFAHVDLGGTTKPGTVKEACEAYLAKRKAESGERAAKDDEGYFKRLVYSDPIANLKLTKLKSRMFDWRSRVLKHNDDRSSFNRNVTALRAALNLARARREVTSDLGWREALRPFTNKEVKAQRQRTRAILLTPEERKRLIARTTKEARPFFKALALLPMRPGEIAALRVEHLSPGEQMLKIPPGKTEERIIPLPAQALAHLKACAKGRMPSDWLIARADGSQWKKEQWRDEVKAAAKKAKLPTATVAYSLRHSLITELVTGKTARTGKKKRGGNFDLFTVAKISGTSVRMIEQTYGHLQQEHARKALETLALAL